MKPVVYCEIGAFVEDVKKLWRSRSIKLIHFPYDRHDRNWHRNKHIPFARPSLVTADTTQVYANDPFLISDMTGSNKYNDIARILRKSERSPDVRHFGSAVKSDASAFITAIGTI